MAAGMAEAGCGEVGGFGAEEDGPAGTAVAVRVP